MTEQLPPFVPTPQTTVALPQPGTTAARVMVNLDALENDAKREPFSFVLNGRQIVLADPGDLDWRAIDKLEDERGFLKLAMSDEDLGFFLEQAVPMWKMDRLGKAYQDHYGMEDPGKVG
jgi:hypothetical protein